MHVRHIQISSGDLLDTDFATVAARLQIEGKAVCSKAGGLKKQYQFNMPQLQAHCFTGFSSRCFFFVISYAHRFWATKTALVTSMFAAFRQVATKSIEAAQSLKQIVDDLDLTVAAEKVKGDGHRWTQLFYGFGDLVVGKLETTTLKGNIT